MKRHNIDFHTHSHLSDGILPPQQLLNRAKAAGIRTMAITDHNRVCTILPQLQENNPDIRLIQGCEVSCLHPIRPGKEVELHVVALGFDPNSLPLKEVLAQNQPNRRPYIEAILEKLAKCNIYPGTYEELVEKHPETTHFGRMNIAASMVEKGYVSSVDEAFDVYIGAFGERRAFVPNPLRYASLESAVGAILAAGGLPVLAHLYYYLLHETDQHKLLSDFRSLCKGDGGMEVNYGPYSPEQRACLMSLAREYKLLPSAASDFHGQNPTDTLKHGFSAYDHLPILERLGIAPRDELA